MTDEAFKKSVSDHIKKAETFQEKVLEHIKNTALFKDEVKQEFKIIHQALSTARLERSTIRHDIAKLQRKIQNFHIPFQLKWAMASLCIALGTSIFTFLLFSNLGI